MKIDGALFAWAEEEYYQMGYTRVSVPWIVDRETIDITLPPGSQPVACLDGYLVGSAEQSFLHLIKQGKLIPGLYQAITPCFRDEQEDELHLRCFMKLELINTLEVSSESLQSMIRSAMSVMSRAGLQVSTCKTQEGTDLVCSKTGIELGSYGIRDHALTGGWVYGTGLAEPRFSQVQDKVSRY